MTSPWTLNSLQIGESGSILKIGLFSSFILLQGNIQYIIPMPHLVSELQDLRSNPLEG
jgi:hypothetical protein